MTNELQVFNNAEFGKVRTVTHNGEIWFVGKDVASALGYTKLDAMYRIIDDLDKWKINPQTIEFTGFPQNGATLESNPNVKILVMINESGLYQAIFNSTLSTAKQFKHWVTSEVLPSIRKTGSYSVKQEKADELKEKRVNALLKNAKAREAKLWLELANRTDIKEYKQIAESYAGNVLAEKEVFALPQVEKKTYSATEIAKILNVSAKKIGALANKYNLKTEQFGKWFYDKSRYSNKEVETFRYYENAISQFRFLLGGVMA